MQHDKSSWSRSCIDANAEVYEALQEALSMSGFSTGKVYHPLNVRGNKSPDSTPQRSVYQFHRRIDELEQV